MRRTSSGDRWHTLERHSSRAAETGAATAVTKPVTIEKYVDAIQRYLMESKSEQTPLSKALVDILEEGGKRIRPIVALLSCEAVSGSYEKALPVAAAFELAHSASLVQDDIIDESETRHGQVATHKKYGTIRSILISDMMIFEIFVELGRYRDTELPQRRLGQIVSLIGKAAKLTAEGEFFEMSLAEKGNVEEKEYVRLAELKTGSLFAAAAACGALVGGARRKLVDSAYEFGLNLGVSFQIRDDILDIIGNEAAIGKPLLKDLQNNASNMVLIHAMAHADTYQRQALSSMLYKKWFTMSDVSNLMETLNELDSINHSRKMEREYAARAKACLESFPVSSAKSGLEQLTEGLVSRTK